MAHEPAMTPQDALTTLASLKGYRERLTAQAAGIVWMVWGLVVAIVGFVTFYARGHVVEGTKEVAYGTMALTVAVGALLSNAVWRAHALETERPQPWWIPYLAGGLALAGVVAAEELLDALLGEVLRTRVGLTPLGFAPLNLAGAAGAFTIALLQRRRVRASPGITIGCILLAVYLIAKFGTWSQAPDTVFFASFGWAALCLVSYVSVGLWTTSHG